MSSAVHPWPQRSLRVLVAATWFVLAAVLSAPSLADDAIAKESHGAVQEGRQLELGRKWNRAFEHYEAALKRWPDVASLKHGLRRSRIQCTIARRYTDYSFHTSLIGLSRSDAMTLFDETLRKVSSNFVEQISLTSFVAHGTESVYLSLANQKFLDRHLRNTKTGDSSAVRDVRRVLFKRYWNRPIRSSAEAHRVVSEICQLAHSRLGLPPSSIVLEFVFGGCNALDDYSGCLTPHRYTDLNDNIDGRFVGMGVELKSQPGKGMLLVNVLPDSPASQSGLKAGDHITKIDTSDCRQMTTDEAASLLKGVVGSRVTLGIHRAVSSRQDDVTIVRRSIVVRSIPLFCMLDQQRGIGYIQMTGFQRTSLSELDHALATLRGQHVKAIIWDLRHNPGGLLNAATEVLDRFIASGVLVSTRGRTWDQNRVYRAHLAGTCNLPLVVLTDGDSASASEIVAGAVKDHHRGQVIGRRSYGKWSVQSIFPLSASSGLRLTTARFYSPNGHNLAKVGVEPDISVDPPQHDDGLYRHPTQETLPTDPDIIKALEQLRGRLAG